MKIANRRKTLVVIYFQPQTPIKNNPRPCNKRDKSHIKYIVIKQEMVSAKTAKQWMKMKKNIYIYIYGNEEYM